MCSGNSFKDQQDFQRESNELFDARFEAWLKENRKYIYPDFMEDEGYQYLDDELEDKFEEWALLYFESEERGLL